MKYIQPIGFSNEQDEMFGLDFGKKDNKIGNVYYHDVRVIKCIPMVCYGYGLKKTAPPIWRELLLSQPLIILN